MGVTRRWLLVAASAVTAGCSLPVGRDGVRTVFDGRVDVPAGEARVVTFEVDRLSDVRFFVEVHEGPRVDVLFLSRSELDAYRSGEAFTYRYTSGEDVRDGWAEDGEVPPGSYAVVYDNTDAGVATPGGESVTLSGVVEISAAD